MDRSKWEKTFTHFQARVRGYLVRREVIRAREDFEEIVKEIDGGLTHLKWTDAVISVPHFTDTDDPYPRLCSSASKASDPGVDVSVSPHGPAVLSEQRRDNWVLSEKTEAEKDDSQASLFGNSLGVNREGQRQGTVGIKDAGVTESTESSSTIWSSLELDVNSSQSNKGPRQYCLARDVPCSPKALRLHRNTLTMELVWLQQAIDSRKNYLSLKNRLSVS
ncbi:IQ domain-containing protein C [Mugil cephalus]|uniref:IQ domain-containing protein C n=1 Tax=Mugil cephalus TaxID=48193 RepID=UPI001FB77B4F|nr:IQ domain-containing protein C [Mugil cephalus]